MKPSVLRIIIATLALAAVTSAFAQKKDSVSPNEPKVTMCHNIDNNPHSITVAQSAVAAHLAHGDTLGSCETETKVLVCHRGRTLSIPQSALATHLAHGDSPGECSAVSRSAVTSSFGAPVPAGLGNPALPQPQAAPLAKPVSPAQPQTPLTSDEISICYKGQTVNVVRTSVQTYLSIGATLGACPQKQAAAPAKEEVVVAK
jgi:hypothetical protein